MAMNSSQATTLLSLWVSPSSASEAERMERAERMIRDAINRHPTIPANTCRVYAKGSYANNTNVRLDSDVDIVVENQQCIYYKYRNPSDAPAQAIAPYTGIWTREKWRHEVEHALGNYFGWGEVDTTGNTAILVKERPGSRPSADVVPSFPYELRGSSLHTVEHGSTIWTKDQRQLVNWPQQQLDNGTQKNTQTGHRYKKYARALKRAENELAHSGTISAKPSYLMECLFWNVPNAELTQGDLLTGFLRSLEWLYGGLRKPDAHQQWTEPNAIKYLFHPTQKWSVQDAKDVVYGAYELMAPS